MCRSDEKSISELTESLLMKKAKANKSVGVTMMKVISLELEGNK